MDDDRAHFEYRTPVIQLWGRLVVPLQGDITDEVAAALVDDVLRRIRDSAAAGLVLDVTGMWTIDSHLCHVIAGLATAAHLMGTPTVLCGMSGAIAITLQTMGIDFRQLHTALTLEDALERLGVTACLRDIDLEVQGPPSPDRGDLSDGYASATSPRDTIP
ncbi:rsbT antagonist protein RsbS [Nannocystis exedens]|uniref:RsbT antagonist protein RsbS n=1 Tax=Nannocystis exedens TaxID=54 RepID=A0A1I2FNE2_9BACT|nr:STAS domain-containing protein [Nannocystis exedens]PCC74515.1 anti-anti-sigma factor [Nannocystis exedens]SFF07014.1 rsbT antagonist protein RsbS [Nannocystis exedens]